MIAVMIPSLQVMVEPVPDTPALPSLELYLPSNVPAALSSASRACNVVKL